MSQLQECVTGLEVAHNLTIYACKAILFFSPFSVVRPTQIFGIFEKKKK